MRCYIHVKAKGKSYEIPAMWLVAMTRSTGYAQAVQHWIEQTEAANDTA